MSKPICVSRLLTCVGLVVLTGFGLTGCPGDEVPVEDETGGTELLPGALVITEVAANAPGADGGKEWFELHNASGESVDLQGLVLIYEKADGSGHKEHTIARSVEVPPGGYVVVGGIIDELAGSTAHVDYGYGAELGEFGNSAGYLAIGGGGEIIDEIYYVDALETASRVFDGSRGPDALLNNDAANWCDSKTAFTPEYAATPRAPNDACEGASTCMQDGQPVDIVRPQLGDIVITEVMPNPTGTDAPKEWFELRSRAAAPFQLNGLQLGTKLDAPADDTITSASCITLAPDETVIIAQSGDMVANGMLPAEAIIFVTDQVTQTLTGSLWVGVAGEHLDEVTWSKINEGVAWQLSPIALDPTANDDPGNWCDADVLYNETDYGTPGGDNTACPLPPPPEGQCYEDGQLRDIVQFAVGELDIVEYHANPSAVSDGDGEWFEVVVSASGDLNGLMIGKAGDWADEVEVEDGDVLGVEPGVCASVSPGQRLVFAHEPDPLVNCELPQVDVLFDMALNNSNSDVMLGYDLANPVAQASWTSVSDGASTARDAMGNWCDGQDVYGCGDLGSPGAANPACEGAPPGDQCIDPDTQLMRQINFPSMGELELSEIMPNPSLAEPGAEWFEIHALADFDLNGLALGKAGVVSHVISTAECIEVGPDSYAVLARSDVMAVNCDLPSVTYVYGSLALSNSNNNLQVGLDMDADDMFDVVLGEHAWVSSSNGVALSYDPMSMSWCPAVDVFGCGDAGTPGAANPACGGGMMGGMCFDTQLMQMRAPVVPVAGDLVITEFMANPDPTPDADGEWLEVRALAGFDLNGLYLGRDHMVEGQNPLHVISDANCLSVSPGDFMLIARSDDPMVNGGLPPVDYVLPFGLTNSNSGLYLASDVELLDQISWTSVGTGRSTSLDPDNYDPALNDTANNAAPWCYMVIGQETPGMENLQCP